MKKHKLFSFLSVASMVTVVPFVVAACGGEDKVETGTIKTTFNRAESLGNIKGTAGQVQNVYTNTLKAVTKVMAKLTSTSTEKTALTKFEASLKTLNGLMAKTGTGSSATFGGLRLKIESLDSKGTDYPEKLKAVRTDLINNISTLKNAYIEFVKALDNSAKDNDTEITKEFNNHSQLRTFFSKQPEIKIEGAQFLDLARLFESFNGSIENTAVNLYDTTTGENSAKVRAFGKTVAQIFNLITIRSLQTVAMAEVVEKDVAIASLADSFKKLDGLRETRKKLATLPAGYVTKVNGLESKVKALKDAFAEVEKKKAVTGTTSLSTENETKYNTLKTNVGQFDKRYNGFVDADNQPGFIKPGLKKNVSELDKTLKALPDVKVDSVATFNDLFKKASPTWMDAAGMYVNSLVSSNLIAPTKTLVTDLTTAITGTGTQDVAFKAELTKLTALLDDLKTEYEPLVEQKANATPANEVSAWKLNQNVRAISSFAQLLLLQAAIDAFPEYTNDNVAFGAVSQT